MAENHRKLINHPDRLIEDLVEGMILAHPDLLCIEGDTGRAIVARSGPRDGKVGIVVGGDSGHEPAFAGYVGKGLADAAPLGNIFASPSPAQIMDAGFAADGGEGVLFLYGNYTGDVMNFGMAAEGLAEHGISAKSFVVTDDIASAPPDKTDERRGIAGDFFVFKVAGAAADQGASLAEVEAAATRANAATRTMGVALSACVLPQTGRPNFELPVGEMEIGMGIHGEPGIERGPAESADAVADRLLAPIMDELELAAGDRVAVLVNGLGSTSLLELYLLHRRVATVLSDKQIDIHKSWVGEYCTSLDMEGASITLMRLDPDLLGWLDYPCETPALRVGQSERSTATRPDRSRIRVAPRGSQSIDRETLRTEGDIGPDAFRGMMQAGAKAIFAARDELCALDGKIGDGDHGVTMEIGWKAVLDALTEEGPEVTITELCDWISEVFLEAVGASAGPLYASGFQSAGQAVSDRLNLDAMSVAKWLDGLARGIAKRGQTKPGEKTMLDVWRPAADAAFACARDGASTMHCLRAASQAARAGAAKTAGMMSSKGRSQKLGERVLGHVDPGAQSAAILLTAWTEGLANRSR